MARPQGRTFASGREMTEKLSATTAAVRILTPRNRCQSDSPAHLPLRRCSPRGTDFTPVMAPHNMKHGRHARRQSVHLR